MDHLAYLEGEVVAMADALRAVDLATPVPACPGWTRQDLCNHLSAVHRWVRLALDDDGSPPFDESVVSSPDDYEAAAAAMVTRLREMAPDAPCCTFNRENRTASFWRRRQLQEVSVHRWDAEEHAIDPLVAADGVGEVVDFFLPRMLGQGRTEVPDGTVVLDDGTRTWTVRETEGPRAVVQADAPTLNLLLWGRRTLKDTTVEGDAAFATAFFDSALTP
jgi:uncharacterized protein (TIGR03083 family)